MMRVNIAKIESALNPSWMVNGLIHHLVHGQVRPMASVPAYLRTYSSGR